MPEGQRLSKEHPSPCGEIARRTGVPTSPEGETECPKGRINQKNIPRRAAKSRAAQASQLCRKAPPPARRAASTRRVSLRHCHKEANQKGSKPFGLPPRMSMPRKQIYKFTAPTPGSTCSRACPSESSSASAKALPNNCIPTGMPLSAPRPTGMESPGSPARFSESV